MAGCYFVHFGEPLLVLSNITGFSPVLFRRVLHHSQVHSHSVDPRKLCGVCVAINYTPLSMAYMYYTYDSTANFLFFRPTALTCIYIYTCTYQKNGSLSLSLSNIHVRTYQKNGSVKRSYMDMYVVLEILNLNQ